MANIEQENPFSKEKAWLTWQENREMAARLREELRRGLENGASTREQLLRSVEIIGRLTDNTILLTIVQRSLESRDRKAAEAGGTAEEKA